MLHLALSLLNLAFSNVLASTSAQNVVNVGYASYLGNQLKSYPNTVAYLGIPYAEPPLGELRWRAPLPLNITRVANEANGSVINATAYPMFCVQGTIGLGGRGGAGSEDCLKVNIYTPVGAKDGDNLPVMVYIHGGGYIYGNPANWPFDSWVHQSPNVVIVSVYYRLGSFGFLSNPDFVDGLLGDFNVGFKDQRQALRWVKQYIGAFGGDPHDVTINGQSAGGSSVELHMIAEDEELFSGAIAQSVTRTPVPTPEDQKPLFDFYASQASCENGTTAVQMACLRNASVSALTRAQDAAVMGAFSGPYNLFRPVLDGELIMDYPTKLFQEGKFKRVPFIVGATSNETLSGGSNIAEALKVFTPGLTDTDLEEFLERYPISDFDSASQRFQVATGESDVICSREIMGTNSARYSDTWTYRYNQPNPTSGSDLVTHAAENWMMFQGTNTGTNGTTSFTSQTPIELAFASELIAYWLSFVRSHNPNTYKLSTSPTWDRYNSASQMRIVLQQQPDNDLTGSGSYMEVQPKLETERCNFVASKAEHQQN